MTSIIRKNSMSITVSKFKSFKQYNDIILIILTRKDPKLFWSLAFISSHLFVDWINSAHGRLPLRLKIEEDQRTAITTLVPRSKFGDWSIKVYFCLQSWTKITLLLHHILILINFNRCKKVEINFNILKQLT